MKTAAINLRTTQEKRDLIDQAAQILGKNRSDFIFEVLCDKARDVILDQVFFSLDQDAFTEFTAALDAPLEDSVGLKRLMAVQPAWDSKEAKGS